MNIELTDVMESGEHQVMCALNITDDEGNVHRVAHLMPKDIIEWRVAEYDLDPEDTDTLLDVVLYEHHVQASGHVAPEDSAHLAPTRAHAREALLGAIAACKGPKKKLSAKAAKADPETQARAKLRDMLHMDPEVVAAKREYVDLVREEHAQARAQQARSATPPSPSQPDRLATITRILQMKKGGPGATHADD